MNADLELRAWQTDWLAANASDSAMLRIDLRRLVDRKRRRMALALSANLLVGVALLAFSAWFASTRPTLEWILWAAVIWVTTFFAAGFAIWNMAGTWNGWSQSNAGFLDLSRRRCFRELRAVHFGRWFLAFQLAILMPWFSWDFAVHRLPMGRYFFGIGLTVLIAAVYLEWFAFRDRRIRRDLARLDEFDGDEFDSDPQPTNP
jgi:hypothetical protein